MDFDSALEAVGEFGWVQVFHLAVLMTPQLFGGFYTVALSFVGKAPHFVCADRPKEDPCSVQPPCEKFAYDSSFTSIATEWDLVCENQQYAQLAQSAYMIGNFIGCLICGFLGDRFGRLNTGIACNIICVLGQMAGAYAQTYQQFAVNRFVVGFSAGGVGLVIVTMVLENMRSQWRTIGATLLCVSFALSIAFTSMWAYRVREWRTFLWTSNVFMLPFFIFIWFLPKSPRWLLSQGRTQEAEDILFYYGEQNGKMTNRDSLKLKPPSRSGGDIEVKSYGAMDVFRTPEMNRRMRILLWGWGTCGLLYFGLTLSSSNLGGNMYVNVAMSGLVEIPSAFISSFLANRIGRSRSIAGFTALASLGCIAIVISSTPDGEMTSFQTYSALTAKFGVAAAFNLQSLYSSELLPTVIRNVGTGFCFMASRLGGILAPVLIAYCSGFTVYFVYALMSAVYTLSVLTLPETLNKPMPENIDDVENLG